MDPSSLTQVAEAGELIAPWGGIFGMVAAFIWGTLWGSFGNVVVVRLPTGGSLLRPPSHCPACKTPIKPYDNVPIFSYLILRGRCRSCQAKFSPRYMFVELLMGVLSMALWYQAAHAATLSDALTRFAIEFLFTFVLLVLSFIDLEHLILPNVITLPGILVFFGLGFLHPVAPGVWDRVIGVVAGGGVIWAIAEIYYRITKKEGMGLGDAKLLAMMGGLLGWNSLLLILLFASLQGLLVTIPQKLLRKEAVLGTQIPFGPFLSLAAVEYLFWGLGRHVGFEALPIG